MIEKERLVQLVQDAQNQKEGAFNALYETFFEDTYYFINKTVNDPDLAADLTQDTFMDVFEKIGQLQEPTALVSWIRQIAYHRCTGYFRKRKEILLDENEEGGTLFDTVEEERTEFIPDAALDQEDLKRTILQMINDLPLEQRTAVLMRYYDELSVAEIAAAQGVSEGTVKSRLNYGRKAIKECVEGYEKKNGVKLHSVAIIPILLWLFRFSKLKGGRSLTNTKVAHKVVSTANTATAATATTTATATTAGAKATAVAAGKTAGTATGKAAGSAVAKGFLATTAAKVIAGVTAAALVVGGVGVGIVSNNGNKDAAKPDKKSTIQAEVVPDVTPLPSPSEDEEYVEIILLESVKKYEDSKIVEASTYTYNAYGLIETQKEERPGSTDITINSYNNDFETSRIVTKTDIDGQLHSSEYTITRFYDKDGNYVVAWIYPKYTQYAVYESELDVGGAPFTLYRVIDGETIYTWQEIRYKDYIETKKFTTNGLLSSITYTYLDESGNSIKTDEMQYDFHTVNGELVQKEGSYRQTITYYDNQRNTTRIETKQVSPDDKQAYERLETFDYDEYGTLIAVYDEYTFRGKTTIDSNYYTAIYDQNGNLLSCNDDKGDYSITNIYNQNGTLVKTTQRVGRKQIEAEYDDAGHLIYYTKYEYNEIDGSNHSYGEHYYAYSEQDNLISFTLDNTTYICNYDENGRYLGYTTKNISSDSNEGNTEPLSGKIYTYKTYRIPKRALDAVTRQQEHFNCTPAEFFSGIEFYYVGSVDHSFLR